jgi:deazaflavin-dependent oxidoreductase (nitroreductase family)
MAGWNDEVIAEFRGNDGRTGRWGDRLVVMHSIGARSGQEHLNPVMGSPRGDDWIVIASKGGAPENPAWYYNLVAHPEIEVEARIGGKVETVKVRARELTGDEYTTEWASIAAAAPGFQSYQDRTERVIPLFRLDRV